MVGKEKLKERVRLAIHTAAEGHFLKQRGSDKGVRS